MWTSVAVAALSTSMAAEAGYAQTSSSSPGASSSNATASTGAPCNIVISEARGSGLSGATSSSATLVGSASA
jgi:hypothetical protein